MSRPDRRTFLRAAAAAAVVAGAKTAPISIIDCHIHLFDPTRPQGVPYSGGRRNREPGCLLDTAGSLRP